MMTTDDLKVSDLVQDGTGRIGVVEMIDPRASFPYGVNFRKDQCLTWHCRSSLKKFIMRPPQPIPPMPKEPLKIGDVVRLRSGGPKMTIVRSRPGLPDANDPRTGTVVFECHWFSDNEIVSDLVAEFPPCALTLSTEIEPSDELVADIQKKERDRILAIIEEEIASRRQKSELFLQGSDYREALAIECYNKIAIQVFGDAKHLIRCSDPK